MAISLKVYKKHGIRKRGSIRDSPGACLAKSVGASTWIVESTLDKEGDGGTTYIEIAAKDARVLKVTHGK
jgi:hypothetical protein